MSLKAILSLFPPDLTITLADVGAAGGIKDRWAAARGVVSAMLFEPRAGGGPRDEGRDRIYPFALGAAAGEAVLNLTAMSNMSSTLVPDTALLARFAKKGAHTRVVGSLTMSVDTLDAVVAREGRRVDAIKVDTQGSELEIMKGARTCLADSVIVAEVEISFLRRYEGQPLFRDIDAFMDDAGFEFHDLYRPKRYRAANAAGIGNAGLGGGQRAGRLAYADALFVASEERIAARIAADGDGAALKAIVALLVYGKPDIAMRLFERIEDSLSGELRLPLREALAGFGSLRYRALHGIADRIARNV